MKLFSLDINVLPAVRLIGHVSYARPWKHFRRNVHEYILYFVKSGTLFIREGTREYQLNKGDFLLLEPDMDHYGTRESVCSYYYLHFRHPGIQVTSSFSADTLSSELILRRKSSLHSEYLDYSSDADSCLYFPKQHHYFDDNEIITLLAGAEQDYYQRYEGYKKIASLKLSELLIRICRDFISKNMESSESHFSKAFLKCRKIQQYLNANYQNRITSEDISHVFESNYDYLNRSFRQMTGFSILNYLNLLRIEHAKLLFDTSSIHVAEAGYLVGIDDPYYFSRLFKKITGITPTQYMERKNQDA